MRILVTGSNGFIGRHLMTQFARGSWSSVDIVTWSRREHGDLLSVGALEHLAHKIQPSVIVHLAWSSTWESNYALDPRNELWVEVGTRLLHLSQTLGMWVLYSGSAADELSEKSFDTPYGRAKCELRTAVNTCPNADLWTWFRPQYVYSLPHRRPALLRQLHESANPEAFTPERPDDLRDWIDVRDVASGIAAILAKRVLGVVDVGSGKAHTVQQFLKAARLGETEERAAIDLQLWEEAPRGADIQPLENLGWSPSYTQALFASLGRS